VTGFMDLDSWIDNIILIFGEDMDKSFVSWFFFDSRCTLLTSISAATVV